MRNYSLQLGNQFPGLLISDYGALYQSGFSRERETIGCVCEKIYILYIYLYIYIWNSKICRVGQQAGDPGMNYSSSPKADYRQNFFLLG